MISSVTLGDISLKCDSVRKPRGAKIAKIQIPGRDGEIIQNLGLRSKNVELRGILIGTDKDTDKSTLEGYEGTNQTYTDTDESFTMTVETVDIPTEGGFPNHYNFTIRGVKYDQT